MRFQLTDLSVKEMGLHCHRLKYLKLQDCSVSCKYSISPTNALITLSVLFGLKFMSDLSIYLN